MRIRSKVGRYYIQVVPAADVSPDTAEKPHFILAGAPVHGLASVFTNPILAAQRGPCRICNELHPTRGSTLGCYRVWLSENLKASAPQMREVVHLASLLKRFGRLILADECQPGSSHLKVLAEWIVWALDAATAQANSAIGIGRARKLLDARATGRLTWHHLTD